jgi:hypothetical protein
MNLWKDAQTNPPPEGKLILIKNKAGSVRIAKRTVYGNGSEAYRYLTITFKNVIYWQPLPE